jgi:hypothetical protein
VLEGTEMAYKADAETSNKLVQLAVNTPLRGCKRYDYRIPTFARQFLAYWGNITNAEVLDTTILEIWASTKEVEAGWLRRKAAQGGARVGYAFAHADAAGRETLRVRAGLLQAPLGDFSRVRGLFLVLPAGNRDFDS